MKGWCIKCTLNYYCSETLERLLDVDDERNDYSIENGSKTIPNDPTHIEKNPCENLLSYSEADRKNNNFPS